MQEISLSGRKGRGLVALVDESDYALVRRWSWCLSQNRKWRYASAAVYGRCGTMMHRLIMGLPPQLGLQVDHINGNGLDNRRENLRWVTQAQNNWNEHARRGGASQYKGVSYDGKNCKSRPWIAQIRLNGTVAWIGHFVTEIEAALAYDQAARALRGEYANINFPEVEAPLLAAVERLLQKKSE